MSKIQGKSPPTLPQTQRQVLEYGPLHMSPVDRAGPVSEISPHL